MLNAILRLHTSLENNLKKVAKNKKEKLYAILSYLQRYVVSDGLEVRCMECLYHLVHKSSVLYMIRKIGPSHVLVSLYVLKVSQSYQVIMMRTRLMTALGKHTISIKKNFNVTL